MRKRKRGFVRAKGLAARRHGGSSLSPAVVSARPVGVFGLPRWGRAGSCSDGARTQLGAPNVPVGRGGPEDARALARRSLPNSGPHSGAGVGPCSAMHNSHPRIHDGSASAALRTATPYCARGSGFGPNAHTRSHEDIVYRRSPFPSPHIPKTSDLISPRLHQIKTTTPAPHKPPACPR